MGTFLDDIADLMADGYLTQPSHILPQPSSPYPAGSREQLEVEGYVIYVTSKSSIDAKLFELVNHKILAILIHEGAC